MVAVVVDVVVVVVASFTRCRVGVMMVVAMREVCLDRVLQQAECKIALKGGTRRDGVGRSRDPCLGGMCGEMHTTLCMYVSCPRKKFHEAAGGNAEVERGVHPYIQSM
jgi:hypothetical protein